MFVLVMKHAHSIPSIAILALILFIQCLHQRLSLTSGFLGSFYLCAWSLKTSYFLSLKVACGNKGCCNLVLDLFIYEAAWWYYLGWIESVHLLIDYKIIPIQKINTFKYQWNLLITLPPTCKINIIDMKLWAF